MQFYPENPHLVVHPLKGVGELRYVLSCPQPDISKKDLTVKFAFAGKWKISSQALKSRIREILVHILDIGYFEIKRLASKWLIIVPLKPLANPGLLPNQGEVEVPLVIKLSKKDTAQSQGFQLKCYQTMVMQTNIDEKQIEELGEAYLELPNGSSTEEQNYPLEDMENLPTIKLDMAQKVLDAVLSDKPLPNSISSATDYGMESIGAMEAATLPNIPETSVLPENFTPTNPPTAEPEVTPISEPTSTSVKSSKLPEVYSGIMAIDFGTTNSVVVVRDPLFAAEEIKEDLSREQWTTLMQWVDSWVIHHLSVLAPSEQDLFVEEITRYVPEMDVSPCGSLSVDIWEDLQRIPKEAKAKFLEEVIANFSNFDIDSNNHKILQDLAGEVMNGFEKCVYSKTLESQRYFILELDENAGTGPISSALQIISAPPVTDQEQLYQETKVEMGMRVHLLMRSAALREADIRQFVLTIKRYFGQEQKIELVPSETEEALIQFSPEILCRLAYQKLIQRALSDIQNRSRKGEMKYADGVRTIVATFPTTYPASLRRKLRDMMNELKVQDIDTRFDEGTASALYYIWREVCADPVCGMHGLMARCRRDRHGRAYQNLLLYDLGGGTTDIALLQLIYEELPIFEPMDKTKSLGGQYFRITPKLLGATGHRYIGGDLLTLWLFRIVKTKIVDRLLTLIYTHEIEIPFDCKLAAFLSNNLPEDFADEKGRYRSKSILHIAYQANSQLRRYEQLNQNFLDVILPTRFFEDTSNTANFFILWDLTEAAKKQLGTPISTYSGSGLGSEWPEIVTLDAIQIEKMLFGIYPWLEKQREINTEDWKITISQHELTQCTEQPVIDSLSLAINLAQARLTIGNITDRIDRLIFSGLSCNLKIVQEQAKKLFQKTERLFDFSLANVFFEPDLAKTSVAMGACIGRYLESVRLDPGHEKTRQLLREGYDQVDLVVENLFTNLACRLVYDSLIAMVSIFEHGQELSQRSFIDGKPVARTPMNELRPVQEKFWIYRIDFEGAQPQYLGLINAEAIAYNNDFDDFRKFREQYLVGFEADAELFVRAFFLPRGPKNILALSYLEDSSFHTPIRTSMVEDKYGYCILQKAISSQELFNRRIIIPARTKMVDTIQYPDGSRYRCALSQSLPIREMYDVYLEDENPISEPQLISHFHLDEVDAEEITLACDETGRVVLLLAKMYDIKIWADIDYVPQKVDSQYDPFCGEH